MPPLLSRHSLEHAAAGSVGSVAAGLLVFPLERLKTLQQVHDGRDTRLRHLLPVLVREEGVGALYRGCGPTAQTVGLSSFLYFFLFHGLKRPLAAGMGRRDGSAGAYATLLAAAVAGALNMLVTEPLWRACVVAQKGGVLDPPRGVFGTALAMRAQEGSRALWRGLGSSMWLVTNPIIQHFCYDFLKAARQMGATEDISTPEALALGALAKALATVATFPLQVAQSRLRAARGAQPAPRGAAAAPGDGGAGATAGAPPPELGGTVACLRAVLRERGPAGLYLGLYAKLLQTTLQAALMFALYEKVHWVIRRLSRRGVRQLSQMARA